jgi:hypothetical protein
MAIDYCLRLLGMVIHYLIWLLTIVMAIGYGYWLLSIVDGYRLLLWLLIFLGYWLF